MIHLRIEGGKLFLEGGRVQIQFFTNIRIAAPDLS
jgi:hypothetical protein